MNTTKQKSAKPGARRFSGDWNQTVSRILSAYNAISRSINPAKLVSINLTSSQIKVLANFFDQEYFTMTELSTAHSVSLSTMTSMVNRLIQSGYLRRTPDKHDRRVVNVSLTAKGRRMVKQLIQLRRHGLEAFLSQLSDREINGFLKSIESVAFYLDKVKKNRPRR